MGDLLKMKNMRSYNMFSACISSQTDKIQKSQFFNKTLIGANPAVVLALWVHSSPWRRLKSESQATLKHPSMSSSEV